MNCKQRERRLRMAIAKAIVVLEDEGMVRLRDFLFDELAACDPPGPVEAVVVAHKPSVQPPYLITGNIMRRAMRVAKPVSKQVIGGV